MKLIQLILGEIIYDESQNYYWARDVIYVWKFCGNFEELVFKSLNTLCWYIFTVCRQNKIVQSHSYVTFPHLSIAVTGGVDFECNLIGSWFVAGKRDVAGTGLQWSKDAYANHRTVPVRPKTDPVEDTGHTHDRQVQATLGSARSVCSLI